jgi:hypothetical protein
MLRKIIQLLLVLTISASVKAQITIDSTNLVKTCLDCDSIGTSLLPSGSIYIEVSGGVNPFLFSLTGLHAANTPITFFSVSNSATFNQLCQDTFNLKVTDANGDSMIYNFTTIPLAPPIFIIDSVNVESDDSDNPDSGEIELFVTTNADSIFYKIKEHNNSFSLGTLGGWQDSVIFDSLPGGHTYDLFVNIYPKGLTCGTLIDTLISIYSIDVPITCNQYSDYSSIYFPDDACVGEMVPFGYYENIQESESVSANCLSFGNNVSVCSPQLSLGNGGIYYSYSVPGYYLPSHDIFASNGCFYTSFISNGITIHPKPETNFSVTDNGSGNYSFSDMTTGAIVSNWNWDFGDGNFDNVQNPSHQYDSTGTYTVCLTTTSDYSCDSTYCQQLDYSSSVGVDEVLDSKAFSIYPNPIVDQFTIEFQKAQQRTIRILDLTGKTLMNAKVNDQKQTFSLKELATGVYFLELKTAKELKTIKLIKQ